MDRPTLDEIALLHANVCQAISEPSRILILYAIGEKPHYVTELAQELGMPQPTVSRHLNLLRRRGMVTSERDGPAVIYRLADPRIIEVLNSMREILRDALKRQTSVLG